MKDQEIIGKTSRAREMLYDENEAPCVQEFTWREELPVVVCSFRVSRRCEKSAVQISDGGEDVRIVVFKAAVFVSCVVCINITW